MKIQIKGLQAPYTPQEAVIKQIQKTQGGYRYIYRIAIYMMALSMACVLFKMMPSNQVVLSTIIIVFNLVTLVMLITMNEQLRTILQIDLERIGRQEEAKQIKIGYTHIDKVIIAFAVIQVVLQIIQILL